MAEPSFWQMRHHPLSLALTPLAWLYGGLEAARRRLTHAQHPGKPVICVGNLTAGGAGKTPTVRWLAEKIAAQGHQPAILSRGYGGSEKGPLKVDRQTHHATHVGDEPLMLAADWPVYIGADRMQSLRLAVQDGADVLIKDDGFQNPSLAHHFNLIVVDGASGLGNQRLLPSGPMRQPLSVALERLDALLVIGEARHHSLAFLMDAVEAFGKPIFHGRAQATGHGAAKYTAFAALRDHKNSKPALSRKAMKLTALQALPTIMILPRPKRQPFWRMTSRSSRQKKIWRVCRVRLPTARARLAAEAAVLPIALEIADEAALLAAISRAITDGQANRLYKSY